MNTPEEILKPLDKFQRRAVLDQSRAMLINARVGSGKTTTLISKISYLHLAGNVPLSSMVVLTFTNKAAGEIKERMKIAAPGVNDEDMPWFGTFHGVALRLLQTLLPVEKLGYTPAFSLLDPDEKSEMAARLMAGNRFKIKYQNKLAKRIEAFYAGKPLYGTMKYADDIEKLCQQLEEEKKVQNKMDFDDLIRNATGLLKEGTFLPQWVIVDEFQDSDQLQLDFIRALTGKTARIFAVGDPNQVIYSWRGSSKNIFALFREEYHASELSLPVNYRSSGTILEAARIFLEDRNMLEGIREPGNKIIVHNHYNPFMEAGYLAGKINELGRSGVPLGQIAVFYRMQKQAVVLEDVFKKEGIPFDVSEHKTLRDLPALQWMVRLLSAAVNKEDKNSLISVLTDPHFGESMTLARAAKAIDAPDSNGLCEKISQFSLLAPSLGTAAGLYNYFETDRRLSPTSFDYTENKGIVWSFLIRIECFLKQGNGDVVTGIREFLNRITLWGISETEHPDGEDDPGKVRLMTLHASKGLEFRYVFIIGVNNGLIPLSSSVRSQYEEEEERRLFFVGITRAMDYLELSYYTDPGDLRVGAGESFYLQMLPAHLLAHEDRLADAGPGLREMVRQIMKNRNAAAPLQDQAAGNAAPADPTVTGQSKRNVRHPKYGEGVIESENEDSFTVTFPGYGEKVFSKDFCPLEFL